MYTKKHEMCFSELKAGVLKAGVEVVSIDVGKHCICCRSREVVWKWVVSKLSFFSRDTFAHYVAFDHLIIYICPALSIWPALSGMIRWVEAAMASSVYTCFGGNRVFILTCFEGNIGPGGEPTFGTETQIWPIFFEAILDFHRLCYYFATFPVLCNCVKWVC